MEYVCGATWLKSKGNIEKIYKFDAKSAPPQRKQFIYMIRTNLVVFKDVMDQISSLECLAPSSLETGIKPYNIIVFPTTLHIFEEMLECEGLIGLVDIYKFNWDFITLDNGVLSLEFDTYLYKDIFIKHENSLLESVAHTFRLFNMLLKRPNLIFAYGKHAETIIETVNRIENFRQTPSENETNDNPDFNAMIIVDRDKDYVSCLLTSVVYSSLLLELFNYNSGYLTVDPENNKVSKEKLEFLQVPKENDKLEEKRQISMLRMSAADDSIFRENRYRHFTEVTSILNTQAKNLGMESQNYKDMKLNEMKEFVANKLPQVTLQKKELFKHLISCEAIVQELGTHFSRLQIIEENMLMNENRKQVSAYIEEHLSTDIHRQSSIRLMCLLHLTCGLTNEEAIKFITNYCNVFGHQYLNVFSNLSAAKLFPDTFNVAKTNILSNIPLSTRQCQFQIDANKLKLFSIESNDNIQSPEKVSGIKLKKNATCPSYVFNGNYIPLVAQLSSIILKSNNFDEVYTKLAHLETQIKVGGCALGNQLKNLRDVSLSIKKGELPEPCFPLKPRTLFVYVVGGLSYAEIAACNLVERFTGSKLIIASDTIICGNDLIEAAFID